MVTIVSGVENSDLEDSLVVFAGCVSGHDEWILDSTCSFHIYNNTYWFSSKPMQKRDVVLMRDYNSCNIVGIGSV
jgi:hypothetical protein